MSGAAERPEGGLPDAGRARSGPAAAQPDAPDAGHAAYLRALRADHLGEVVGEVPYRALALVALRPTVREQARALAAVEVATRLRLEAELALHGAAPGRAALVRALAWLVLLPALLLLPGRAWAALLLRVTTRAVASFERQQARFGARNPELFAWLVAHEVRQRDWARDQLRGGP